MNAQSENLVDEIEIRQAARQGLKLLIAELALQKRHRTMLREQTLALVASNRKKFVALQEEYIGLLGELEIQGKVRSAFFGSLTVEGAAAGWPLVEQTNARRVASDLKSVLADIRRINAHNRVLIGSQMKYIDFMLELLVKTHRKGAMYGPQGLSSVNRGNMLINRAA
jgi:flagellar biosynthesis/type III secretory pathway chaperone